MNFTAKDAKPRRVVNILLHSPFCYRSAYRYFFAQVLIPKGIYRGHIFTAAVANIIAPKPQSTYEIGLCIAKPAPASTTPAANLIILSVDPIFSFNINNSCFNDCPQMNLSFCSESDWIAEEVISDSLTDYLNSITSS